MNKMTKNKLELIQVLRAFAAILVVMNHYPGRLQVFASGYIGVDLFFVISGVIMVITTNSNDTSGRYAVDFMIKRFSRICPYYAIMTLIALLLTYKIHDHHALETLTLFLKSVLLVPLWGEQPILEPGWTLTFEMYFYFVFFISLFFNKYRWIFVFSFFLLALTVFDRIDSYNHAKDIALVGDYLKMFSTGIVWCFIMGVVVGLLFNKKLILNKQLTVAITAISLALLLYNYFSSTPQHGPLFGLLFSMLVYGVICIESNFHFKTPRFLVFLGDISFSLYLTQFITISLMERYLLDLFSGEIQRYLMVIPFISVNIIVAYFAYKTLELPIDKSCKRALRKIVFGKNVSSSRKSNFEI
ncbi:TPA: acyltransferase [Yersinia enterocolitica]|nr:acyltransferase [Yersinia enterocolitica]MBX9490527.1 acyltransferase [Yersinia enterocolitica]CNF00543.1 O-acetyltransferase OatA [Yersinia enterocolitica]HDL6965103.1 acyltransferase [Yersinia enterocolitica]HDL6969433.1 acyltransferase [Yersinia enterocolitica]